MFSSTYTQVGVREILPDERNVKVVSPIEVQQATDAARKSEATKIFNIYNNKCYIFWVKESISPPVPMVNVSLDVSAIFNAGVLPQSPITSHSQASMTSDRSTTSERSTTSKRNMTSRPAERTTVFTYCQNNAHYSEIERACECNDTRDAFLRLLKKASRKDVTHNSGDIVSLDVPVGVSDERSAVEVVYSHHRPTQSSQKFFLENKPRESRDSIPGFRFIERKLYNNCYASIGVRKFTGSTWVQSWTPVIPLDSKDNPDAETGHVFKISSSDCYIIWVAQRPVSQNYKSCPAISCNEQVTFEDLLGGACFVEDDNAIDTLTIFHYCKQSTTIKMTSSSKRSVDANSCPCQDKGDKLIVLLRDLVNSGPCKVQVFVENTNIAEKYLLGAPNKPPCGPYRIPNYTFVLST